jgi:hypothetical protein
MNWYGFLTGVFFLALSTAWMLGNRNMLDIEKNGTIVRMRIIRKPNNCIGTRAKYYMKVSYNGQVFWKSISPTICGQYKVGDDIYMRYLSGSKDILYPNESVSAQYIFAVVVAFIGLAIMVYGVLSKSKSG